MLWFVELTTLLELNATRLDIGISYLLSQIYCEQMQFDLYSLYQYLDATSSVIHNLYGQVSLALDVRVSAARAGKCRPHHRFARVKTIFQDNKCAIRY